MKFIIIFPVILMLAACDHLDIGASGHRIAAPPPPGPEATQKDAARHVARLKGALAACNAQFPQGEAEAPKGTGFFSHLFQ